MANRKIRTSTARRPAGAAEAATHRREPSRCAFDGVLYRREETSIAEGYAAFHEVRFARYRSATDS
jgi:hypothetical protein